MQNLSAPDTGLQDLCRPVPDAALHAFDEDLRPLSDLARPSRMTTYPTETSAPVSQATEAIRWPEGFRPEQTAVHIRNEIVIPAPISAVWRALIRAGDWPNWYPNAGDIHFISHAGPVLRDRSRIRWNTFGVRISSKVLEFEPETRLAWNLHGIGVEGYHAWLLTPMDQCRTRVVTEETEHGWLARLGKLMMPHRLDRKHQLWLEALSKEAQNHRDEQPAASSTRTRRTSPHP